MSLIRNERTKLTATYFNGIAVAVFVVGGFAPLVTSFSSSRNGPTLTTSVMALICLLVSGGLHYIGRALLKGLNS
jgi:hypothetical protein